MESRRNAGGGKKWKERRESPVSFANLFLGAQNDAAAAIRRGIALRNASLYIRERRRSPDQQRRLMIVSRTIKILLMGHFAH